MAKSEFVSAFDIAAGVFKKLSNEVRNLGGGDEHLRRIETDSELRCKLAQTIMEWGKAAGATLQDQLVFWIGFWAEHGFTVNPAEVVIPSVPDGFGPARLIVIPQGLTIERTWEIAKSLFPCYTYINGNLDEAIPTSDRTADKTYSTLVRDRQEADDEFRNLSANQLRDRGHKGITALETIVDEVGFFKRTGKHRDVKNITLCAGSRRSDGDVPGSRWNDGKFYLNWYNPDNANDNLRSREKFQLRNPATVRDFYFRYFIQPLVILEISCKSDSSSMYLLFLIKFNS